ncbi:hypothetical protein AX14_003364 [Amanita brunnescens Koide BX004]|nr:hypothetical protein AX14_003364 [Amanita brunnescens Koide BX004]
MDCNICELKQRQFYCEACIRIHLRDLRRQIQHFCIDRDEQVARATRALESVAPARIRRADVSSHQQLLEDIQAGLAKLRKENDKKRDRLRLLRETLATRRRNLSAAKLHWTSFAASSLAIPAGPPTLALHQTASRERQELNTLALTISRARSGLVQELVEVFNVVEVGGRPPIGGKPGTKGEWTIGTLTLPVPGDMRRYPPDHINAVITHTVHFLSLLTFYLGIKLPFEISWNSGKLGVGQPWIGAGKGGETGGWARWTGKHCLHVSASVPPSSGHRSSQQYNPSSPYLDQPTSSPLPQAAPLSSSPSGNQSMVESTYHEEQPPLESGTGGSSFMAALAMLIYNVTYLAFTQSVEIPLSQAGDVLSNLWRVCCSSELGKKSHETTPILHPPTPATFPLDFSQLLQATTANPVSRARLKLAPGKIRPERTASAPSTPTVSLAISAGKPLAAGGTKHAMHASMIREDSILEDEDEEGWNLVGTKGEFGSSNDWS